MTDDQRLTRDEVAHVAALAKLHLTDEELDRFTGQLAVMLDHAADMASVDVTGVSPTVHAMSLTNVFREDEPVPGVDREEVLARAPAVEDHRFRVPRILGEMP